MKQFKSTKDEQFTSQVMFASLPGPTRKRKPSPYCYRLTYTNPDPETVGCALLWEVLGGREVYQLVLERERNGGLRWHCSCADAIYRGEQRAHVCKHVRGLLTMGRKTNEPCPETNPAPDSPSTASGCSARPARIPTCGGVGA